jgi:hypothetical protein
MGKQILAKQILVVSGKRNVRKLVAALVLVAALMSVPLIAPNLSGPVASLFVETAYAGCSMGGTCG